jgi:hypothetical protein
MIMKPIRRYRPRGQNVIAFRYTDPAQADQLLDWLTRVEGHTVHGRLTRDGVVEVRRDHGEVSVVLGSFVVREADGAGWAVQSAAEFFERFEPLPIEAPIFPDGEVA